MADLTYVEPTCAKCNHPERLHAKVGDWCAHRSCAKPCHFEATADGERDQRGSDHP